MRVYRGLQFEVANRVALLFASCKWTAQKSCLESSVYVASDLEIQINQLEETHTYLSSEQPNCYTPTS